MKLITFNGGRVGRLELEEGVVIELDVPSTREYFERGGQVTETGERLAYADVKLEATHTAAVEGDELHSYSLIGS